MAWITGLVTLAGGALASQSAKDAAGDQSGATQAGIGEQRRQYDTSRGDTAPWRYAGRSALEMLLGKQAATDKSLENFDSQAYLAANPDVLAAIQAGQMPSAWYHYQNYGQNEGRKFFFTPESQQTSNGILGDAWGPEDALADPGYQFGLTEGQKALERRAAAAGGRLSGASLKAAARYGTDYASTKYGESYQRRQDFLNRLTAIAGLGQTATGQSIAAGANSSNAITQALMSQGDASGAARIAQGNIWSGTLNSLASLYGRPNNSSSGRASFRWDDPYRNPSYYGGSGGE